MTLPGKGVLEVIGAVTAPVMVVFINVKVSDISLNTLNSWSMVWSSGCMMEEENSLSCSSG